MMLFCFFFFFFFFFCWIMYIIALGNGGKTDKYSWSQTLADLCVNIPLPVGTKTKMLDVVIKNTHLKVREYT